MCFPSQVMRFPPKYRSYKTSMFMIDTLDPTSTLLGGNHDNNDIMLLSHEKVNLILDMWTMNPYWETDEMSKMYHIVKRDDPNDIFIGYSPIYNNKNRVLYIFLCRVVFSEKKHENSVTIAYLSVLSGISCPFVKDYVNSYQFKDLIQEAIPIMPIDFKPLLKNPKFRLSWTYDDK